jgi:hypothetical protein
MSKNLAKVQDMLDGNYKNKIQVGVGDQEVEPTRQIGDKWVDSDGTPWEQKEGYKVKGRLATSDRTHPSWDKKCSGCKKLVVKAWDKDTHKADGRCYHCQLNYEMDLEFDSKLRWFAYRRLKDFINMKAIEKDMEQWMDDLEKQKEKNPFDMKVANALANGEVEMSINKNKA